MKTLQQHEINGLEEARRRAGIIASRLELEAKAQRVHRLQGDIHLLRKEIDNKDHIISGLAHFDEDRKRIILEEIKYRLINMYVDLLDKSSLRTIVNTVAKNTKIESKIETFDATGSVEGIYKIQIIQPVRVNFCQKFFEAGRPV